MAEPGKATIPIGRISTVIVAFEGPFAEIRA
jgi:hypothetical protein